MLGRGSLATGAALLAGCASLQAPVAPPASGVAAPAATVAAGAPSGLPAPPPAGRSTVISRVNFEVEGALQRSADAGDAGAKALLDSLRAAWPLAPGTPFRNAVWSDAKAAYVARMRAAGYVSANWIGTGAEVDPERHEVRLFLASDSGPLYRFGDLTVEGLVAHDAQTVRYIADMAPGVPLTDTRLLDFQERLQKSNLFGSVVITVDPDPERAEAARVTVRVREQTLEVYTFGVGVSANTGPRVSVEHVHRRPFGLAAISTNILEYGRDKQSWDGQISSHPGERLYRNLIGAVIERLESDTDVVLSQRVRLGRTKTGPRIERLAYLEWERSSRKTDLGTDDSESVALSANYHGLWRRLDSILLPTEGYSLSTQTGLGYARDKGVGSAPYGRLYARYTHYLPLGGTWFFTGRAEAGEVFLRSDIQIPDAQRFRAGGEDSVRGYDYRSLGPVENGVVGSGNMLFTGSVELARPLLASLPSVWGAVFVDAGNAANSWSDLEPVIGVGVGVRWRSPVGPLKLDYAWAEELRKWRLHFSVGIAF